VPKLILAHLFAPSRICLDYGIPLRGGGVEGGCGGLGLLLAAEAVKARNFLGLCIQERRYRVEMGLE
jgi:hypothetical protein